MEFYNHNATRKRKRSQTKDEDNLKRKTNKSGGCFGKCCTRKQQNVISISKNKLLENKPLKTIVLEQTVSDEKDVNVWLRHLTRSPLYIESSFCQKGFELYNDPCIECHIQYGPDVWENIPKNFQNVHKQLSDARIVPVKQLEIFSGKGIDNSVNEKSNPFKNHVNSFINNIIGDGVDRMSEIMATNQQAENELHIDTKLPATIADDDNWNLTANKTNFDAERTLYQDTSSRHQEPYNWDYQQYAWSSLLDGSHLIDNSRNDQSQATVLNDQDGFSSDDDHTDPAYSIASMSAPDEKQKAYANLLDELNFTSSGYVGSQSKSSLHSNDNKRDSRKRFTSSVLLHHQEMLEQNDRLSATSVSDLFKQLIDGRKQKSIDLESISTAYSIPVTMRPSTVLDEVTAKHPRVSASTEAKQPTNMISREAEEQVLSSSANISEQPSHVKIHDTSWRYFFERLLTFVLPSAHNTIDHNINLSPSIITSNTHSWSTLIPAGTRNMIQSDNIGPWWGRRETDDHTPATFIFANEPLSACYSIEMMTSNKQKCSFVGNGSRCSKYYSCPNRCHYYYNSSSS